MTRTRGRRRRRMLAAAITGLGMVLMLVFWLTLPRRPFEAPLSYVLEARDGTLLSARIAADGQWRFPPGRQVPDKFRRALLVFEDKRFEQHSGLDGLAIARAVRMNLAAGRVVSGGSTLTMQLARLSRGGGEARTLRAKLAESLLALRLEAAHDKDELLAMYAANAPFGGNVVGLEAAAWRYFGRDPRTLSWAEAATLAVLPNNPALVHLKRNRVRLQLKRDFLLRRLHEAGDLTMIDLDLALSEPLAAEPHDLPDLAPHLLDTLRARDPSQHRLRSTLDARLQAQAMLRVNEHSAALSRQDVNNAAALVVDNRNFEVLAYVGNTRNGETSAYAVDIVRRPRSTGSILKPILYAAMLEDGLLTPRMLLPDVPTHFEGFSPENFDRQYRGAVRADEALAASLNIPAVRMLKTYGVARFADLLREAGMSTLTRPADDYGLTLILGGAEGNLWDITGLYASLADIARAGAANGERGFRALSVMSGQRAAPLAPTQIGTGAAWLTLNALLEVPRPGEEGQWRRFANSRAIAWKTGTSWGLRDGWAVGSTGRFTVGVWVGNANGEGRPGLTGSAMAAPLMFGLFNTLPASRWFEQPVHALRQVEVCANDGHLAVEGCETERAFIPLHSHLELQSTNNPRINLDPTGRFRVHSDCASPGEMRHTRWFVLPPAQEFYYRRLHAEYRPLPALRQDCVAQAAARGSLALLYPDVNGRVLIPRELDGSRGRAVFEAVHRQRDATIYWHLDDRYLGETHTFHQQSLDIDPGPHILTLVDEEGQRVSRRFEVLAASH